MEHIKNKTELKTICVAAGKSGGHLIPALELARHQFMANPNAHVILFSNNTVLDKMIAEQYPFISQIIAFSFTRFVAKKFWLYPIILLQLIAALFACLRTLRKSKPAKLITTGGFVALPASIAAKILGIEVELYELNVEPGKAAHIIAFLANRIGVVFSQTLQHFTSRWFDRSTKCQKIAYPVRFKKNSPTPTREELLAKIGSASTKLPFTMDRKTIFLLGGSQGSAFLNHAIKNFIEQSPSLHRSIQIIHQTGPNIAGELDQFYEHLGIPAITFAFSSTIERYYQVADLVICRAGAGTLFELLFFAKQTIIIPLITNTTHHQVLNAKAMVAEHPHLFSTVMQQDLQHNHFLFTATVVSKLNCGGTRARAMTSLF